MIGAWKSEGEGRRTKLDIILAHPAQRLHSLARWIRVLFTVAGSIGHVLLGDGILAVPEGFLKHRGSL